MSVKSTALPIQMTTLGSSMVSGTYTLLSATDGIEKSCISVRIVNDSDEAITISFDGVNDHGYMRMDSDWQIDFQANAMPQTYTCNLKQFTKVWIKGTAGSGVISLSGFYAPQGA